MTSATSHTENRPLRAVLSHTRKHAQNGYYIGLQLECGHTLLRLASQKTPTRVRCGDCTVSDDLQTTEKQA